MIRSDSSVKYWQLGYLGFHQLCYLRMYTWRPKSATERLDRYTAWLKNMKDICYGYGDLLVLDYQVHR